MTAAASQCCPSTPTPSHSNYESSFTMLSTPDYNKQKRMQVNDDDAEDVTHMATTSYTTKHIMREIIGERSENTPVARVNTIHVVATPAEAREWTEHNINLVDSEGYKYEQSNPSSTLDEHCRPRESSPSPENRWTYYQRPADRQQPSQQQVNDFDI